MFYDVILVATEHDTLATKVREENKHSAKWKKQLYEMIQTITHKNTNRITGLEGKQLGNWKSKAA